MKLEIPQFNIFDGRVIHGFSAKSDGNMAFPYGDYAQVLENRQRFLREVGIGLETVVWMKPVHGAKIALVTVEDMGKGALSGNDAIPGVDALITSKKNPSQDETPALAVNPADCDPIIITDKRADYLSVIHGGRKGTELEIATKTITALANQGVYPDDLLVGMGPSICAACYQMPYLETTTPGEWWDYLSLDPNDAKVELAVDKTGELKLSPEGRSLFKIISTNPAQMIGVDVTSFNRDQLIKAGVPSGNIEIMNFCTVEHGRKGKIFSHYLTNENPQKYPEGRFLAVAKLAK